MEGTLVVDKKPKAVWIEAGNLKWAATRGMASTTNLVQIGILLLLSIPA